MNMAINLESVELGATENHLLFRGYVPGFDNFRMFKFDFTGVGLTSTSNLSEKQLERLLEKMVEDFGYPPFDENKAREVLGTWKQYKIEM